MKNFPIIVFFLLAFSFPAFSFGIGARAMAMGGAYTALANDITAAYWNPAGLINSNIKLSDAMIGTGIDGNYGMDMVPLFADPRKAVKEYWGKPADFYGMTNGIAGASMNKIGISYMPWANVTFVKDPAIPPANLSYENIIKRSIAITLGTSFGSPLPFIISPISVGVNLRSVNGELYRETFTGAPPVNITRATSSGIGLDIGAQADLAPNTKAGLVFRNILTGCSWTGKTEQYSGGYSTGDGTPQGIPTVIDFAESENVPMDIVFGIASDIPAIALISADIEYADPYTDLHFGVEKKVIADLLAIRIGYYTENAGSTSKLTAGLGTDLGLIKADIAVGQDNTVSTDRFAVITVSGII